MPERTLDDIKTDLAFRLAERNPDAIEYNVTQEWDTDIETLVGWIDQHIYANQMDAEGRVRTANLISELSRDLGQEQAFTAHLWQRLMKQMDMLEARAERIEQLENLIRLGQEDWDELKLKLYAEVGRLRRALQLLQQSAQTAIDDPHSSNGLFAEPIVEFTTKVLEIEI